MLFIECAAYVARSVARGVASSVASGFDKEMPVERSEIMSIIDTESRPVKTKSKKRKWREIEAIQDQYKLDRELSDLDTNLEYELNEMMR